MAFLETPREEVYGTVAIFRDKFGNKWDLIQTGASLLECSVLGTQDVVHLDIIDAVVRVIGGGLSSCGGAKWQEKLQGRLPEPNRIVGGW